MVKDQLSKYRVRDTRLRPKRRKSFTHRVIHFFQALGAIWILLLAYALVETHDFWRDAESRAKVSEQKMREYSTMLAHVMNGGALYDKAGNTLFFFDKPLIWKPL